VTRVINRNPKRWTDEERKMVAELRGEPHRLSWEDIAERVGHTANSCQTIHSRMRTGNRPMKYDNRPWSANDVLALVNLRDLEKMDWKHIGRLLNRPEEGCRSKYTALRRGADQSAAATEAAALVSKPHTSLTAALLGDPPPGRSALDQRNSSA